MLGKGRAAAITDAEMAALADDLGCHPADLEAIAQVESSGFGWFRDGRIKILFEKHKFYKYVSDEHRNLAVRRGLARRQWISPRKGGYRDQATPDQRYNLLNEAIGLDKEAAYKSISIGRFQIMGFNYEVCGFNSAEAMFEAFVESEGNQLRAFGNFLRGNHLVGALRHRNFNTIEEGYNGGGLNGAYARKMKTEAARLRAGKWKDYQPGSMEPEYDPLDSIVARSGPDTEERTNWAPDTDFNNEFDQGEIMETPKPLTKSKTIWGTITGMLGGGGFGYSVSEILANPNAHWILLGAAVFALIAGGAVLLVFKERIKKRIEANI